MLTSLILVSLYINPRIWMRHLPVKIQSKIPAKSVQEKRQSLIVLILFLITLLTVPAIAIVNYGNRLTFMETFCLAYSINFVFNLTDLLFIDWLIICTFTPSFIKIKGVDECLYKNYWKHLIDFCKGSVVIIIPSFCSSLLGLLLKK